MKKILLFSIFIIIGCNAIFAQGTLKGKITDDKGEALIGVIVMTKTEKAISTSSDIDGNFLLRLPSSSIQVISVSFIGYQTIIDTLFFKKGEEKIKTYIMTPVSIQLGDVQVLGRAKKSDDKYMESVKAKSVSTIDFISSATMKRTGDGNVSAAVGRVAGVSSNGAFISVRGIGDRYIKTTINGLRIPTLDPLTNNIKLDIFPSSLIDNIILTKTPTADLPGDWAGAYISIETKDYPDKLMINVESSFGYNNHTSFKDVLSSERSSDDWLGYNGGKNTRAYDHGSFVEANPDPSMYDQLIALGMGDYLKSKGITNIEMWNKNPDTYTKLALVDLGFLPNTLVNNADAYTKALASYNKQYYNQAFDNINKNAVKSENALQSNPIGAKFFKAPLSNSQSISIGNQLPVFNNKIFGYIVGFKYTSAIQYDPNSTGNSVDVTNSQPSTTSSLKQGISKETNGMNGLVNLAFDFNLKNKISFVFMPNIIGTNSVRDYTKTDLLSPLHESNSMLKTYYESRKQMIYQIKTENYIPGPNLKISGNASYTDGTSNAPDFTSAGYDSVKNVRSYGDGGRTYRTLSEKVSDSKITLELPIQKNSELQRVLKFGGSYQHMDRKSDQYQYVQKSFINSYQTNNTVGSNGFDIDSAVGLAYPKHFLHSYLTRDDSPYNNTMGYSTIQGAFLMFDFAITKQLRLSGGTRFEHAIIYTDFSYFDSLKIASNDPRRYNSADLTYMTAGKLDKTSILPSVAAVYNINNNTEAPLNAKINFAQTVARPSIRELSSAKYGDYELNNYVTGDPELKMVEINNYDVRFEYTTKGKDNISLNLFYKDFKNHIEMITFGSSGYTWDNAIGKSWLKGIEMEGKKLLFKHLEFRGNFSIVQSQSTVLQKVRKNDGSYAIGDTVKNKMYGQAPFIINGILSYTSDSLKLNISLSYNVQGAKIFAVGAFNAPNILERPRNLLDCKISKGIGKHFTASFTVKDILNSPIRKTNEFNGVMINDYEVIHWGTTYLFALSYKL